MTKPKILSPGMRDFLDDRSNELLLSVVTPWEIAIKTNSGKLDGHPVLRKIESSQLNEDVRILRTEISQVIRAGLLPSYHRDPFDRLLAAQALELGIPIISKDGIFDLYGVRRIWH